MPQLNDLLKHVRAAANWYFLGIHLGLERHKLQAIPRDHPSDCESAPVTVFEAWLDDCEDPSWKVVVKALNDCQLGILASEIEDKFVLI